jgi:hypothetical protein
MAQRGGGSIVMLDELDEPECSADVQLPSQGMHTRDVKWRESGMRVILGQDA